MEGNEKRDTGHAATSWEDIPEGAEAREVVDGAPCEVLRGRLYRQYTAKPHQRRLPDGAVPCDPIDQSSLSYLVPVDGQRYKDRWFSDAWINTPWAVEDGQYVAVGRDFGENPYGLDANFVERVGRRRLADCPRDIGGIRKYIIAHGIFGIAWWEDGKVKRTVTRRDLGLEWPLKEVE